MREVGLDQHGLADLALVEPLRSGCRYAVKLSPEGSVECGAGKDWDHRLLVESHEPIEEQHPVGLLTVAEPAIDACMHCAAEGGLLVLVGRCYDLSETSPYGPWREVCAHAPSDAATHFLAALSAGEVSAISSQAALHQQMRDALAALATQQPLVILLDDLHWADPASLDLLRFLARGLSELPLLLLVTYRSDELTRRHLLYALLPTLVREARALRLDLHPREQVDIHALVRRYGLPSADEERLVVHVQGRAEGNPFYAGELLRALEEERTLRPHGTAWQLGDIAGTHVPLLLRQVLDGRLDRLGEATRALLAVAAVIGQGVPRDLCGVGAGTDA